MILGQQRGEQRNYTADMLLVWLQNGEDNKSRYMGSGGYEEVEGRKKNVGKIENLSQSV